MSTLWLFTLLTVLRAVRPSSVEITDNDRSFLISEGDNFTLTCSMKYIIYQGPLSYNLTTQQEAEEEIVPEDSSLFWKLPNEKVIDVFHTAKTQSWPRNRDGITFIKKHEMNFFNVSKSDEGVYKCYGRAVIRQRALLGTHEMIATYSRNSSDVYHVIVQEPGRVYSVMRPTACVAVGQKAEWVGSFTAMDNEKLKVTSWKAFNVADERISSNVDNIPQLAEKSSISYELDGRKTKFGFSEFYLTNSKVSADDPGHYIVSAEDSMGRSKTQHLQLIVQASKNETQVKITPLDQESYNLGDLINVTCTIDRVEPHTNRYTLHFAQCDDISNCTMETANKISSIIYAYPYGNPCWYGLATPPPKVRPESVTIINHKVEGSGVFFCGRDFFGGSARMPLVVKIPSVD